MKNISPAKKGETTKTIIMFIIFFLISEFIIVRPLRNKMESKQREAKEIEQMELEEQKNNVDNGIAGENIIIENEYLKLNINTKGLRLNDVVLKKYKNNVNFDEKVKILNNNYYVDINWLSFTNGLKLPDNNSLWTVKTNNNNTIFSYDNEEGVIFRVILS